ncbi:MAG: hypothetical protein G8345_10795 [Magnetococcales bacterium]|nr:hypothetical protein [Magnetococcales bacterium]NGZ27359.1 hypothetical protein [Magnetococcales bacterium]
MKDHLYLCFLFLCLLGIPITWAGEVIEAQADHQDGVYHLQLVVRMQGDLASIRDLLSDYSQVSRYNPIIRESETLSSGQPEVVKARLVAEDCIILFCTRLVQVQELRHLINGDLQVTILPNESDYSQGGSLWHLENMADGSLLLRVDATMAPNVWIPPLVGPALVAEHMKNRALEMVHNLENLSRHTTLLHAS